MGLETVLEGMQKAWGTARKVFITGAIITAVVGVGYGAYLTFSRNSENFRKTIDIGEGRKVEYLARTPRDGFLSYLPWIDRNGHAMVKFRDERGNDITAVDEDSNGSLLDLVDYVSTGVDPAKETCYAGKAVGIDDKAVLFAETKSKIRNVMIEALKAYCISKRAMADGIYQQVRKQLKAD